MIELGRLADASFSVEEDKVEWNCSWFKTMHEYQISKARSLRDDLTMVRSSLNRSSSDHSMLNKLGAVAVRTNDDQNFITL